MGEAGIPKITMDQMPRLIAGVYGLGSRDFRPEHTIGAYEFAIGQRKRKDGKGVDDGVRFISLGIDHPYEVKSDDAPSLLPDGDIAVRFHSVGGWGAITTGKNLGAIIGDLNDLLYERDKVVDEFGNPKEIIHVSANPKYGSEKKGAPTAYFMVAAPERIRVNCDLRHANVVLCCDPKAFTHCNPLDGMQEGGCLIWESEEEGEQAWERLPLWARQQIIEKKIRVFTLPGFEIARKATDRGDLQLRMQGNAFLGAFFSVSPLLEEFGITQEQFHEVVHKQYVKKFGRLGEGVVKSNMEVMTQGFSRVREIPVGELNAADRSTHARTRRCCRSSTRATTATDAVRAADRTLCRRVRTSGRRSRESRSSTTCSEGSSATTSRRTRTRRSAVMAAGSGDTASKYVARRETPLYIPENCTQCMECIAVCPDTALPNCSQDLETVLRTAVSQLRHRCRRAAEDVPVAAGNRKTHARIDARRGGQEREDPAPGHHSRRDECRRRVLAGGEERVLRSPRQSAAGISEDQRDFRHAGKKDSRRGRRVLHLRVRSVQRVRGVCHGVRRAPGAYGWCRRPNRSTRSTRRAPRSWTCCRIHRRNTWASTATRGRRIPRPPRCATC